MNKSSFSLLAVWAMLFATCKDPYGPPTRSANESYLVVEGYLNGNGPTTIRLSKTFKLDDTARFRPEPGAALSVQSKSGRTFLLSNAGGGTYQAAALPMQTGDEYRLHIRTANGREYYSEFVPYKPTPAIDSISWERTEKGVQLYANTHDPANKTIYYRWDYDETWEFHSAYQSFYEYVNGRVVERDPNINIFACWVTSPSVNIILGSSARLQKDVIAKGPIALIPNSSWKLSVKYSINLRQYALTEKAYQYWQNLLKNSEQLGSIFDPQPSEIRGNIHSATDADELVIGYISAGTIETKRIFISNGQVPGWNYRSGCEMLITPARQDSLDFYFKGGFYSPIDKAETPTGAPAYSFSTTMCVDCRLRGSNERPPFWQ